MNFENIFNKAKELFIKNKDKLPIENSGMLDIKFSTFTVLEDGTEKITDFIVEFCQYQDKSFRIESCDLLTMLFSKDGKLIKSESETVSVD